MSRSAIGPRQRRRHAVRARSTRCSGCTSRTRSGSAAGASTAVGNAAERLGLHPNTLRFRMKKLGVTVRRPPRTGVSMHG